MDLLKHVAELPDRPLPHHLYKAGDDGSLVFGHIADPTIDEGRMIASAIISTPTPDRDDDVIEPRGVVLDDYEKNPVVLWEHGFGSIDTPIAKSVIDGKLAVHVFDDRIEADCQFSHRNKTSDQIFALIADGIVRATSVRVSPIDAVVRQGTDPDRMGLWVKSWRMPEWSWGMIGANPEAVAKTVGDGRIAGSRIAPVLLKSLRLAIPKSTSTTVAGSPMPTPRSKAKSDKAKMETPPPDPEEDDDTKADEPDEPIEPGDDAKADEPMADADAAAVEEAVTQPYGATVLAAVHASLTDIVGNIEAALGPMEQPEVREYLTALVTEVQAKQAEVEGMYGSKYPDADPLAKTDDPEDEALKTWLRSAQGHRLQLAGYGNRLKTLAIAKNLQDPQRKVLSDTVKHLSRIERQAREMVKTVDQSALDDLHKTVTELKERLAKRA